MEQRAAGSILGLCRNTLRAPHAGLAGKRADLRLDSGHAIIDAGTLFSAGKHSARDGAYAAAAISRKFTTAVAKYTSRTWYPLGPKKIWGCTISQLFLHATFWVTWVTFGQRSHIYLVHFLVTCLL